MKTDSIFYRLFKTLPEAFFELIEHSATEASTYNFASVELKQTAFRIDGVFLPTPGVGDRPIYFVEVQFQKDKELYARLFSEIFLYLRLYAPTKPWRAVVIFKSRSMEPRDIEPYRVLLESNLVTRLYLNELEDVAGQPLGVGMMKLVVETRKRTPKLVEDLVDKARREVTNRVLQKQVLDLIETIIFYKLPRISRQELTKMFRLSDFDIRKTRLYGELKEEFGEEIKQQVRQESLQKFEEEVKQEVREKIQQKLEEEVKQEVREKIQQKFRQEVKEEVKEEVKQQVKEEVKEEVKQQVKEEVKEEVKQQVKEEVKEEVKQQVKEEVKEEVKQQVKEEVKEEVKQQVKEEALQLLMRLFRRRLGGVSQQLQEQINDLSVEQLENLAEALFDFSDEADLVGWLSGNSN